MTCPLCDAQTEEFRLIKRTEFSFAILSLHPLKFGHCMVLPKRHIINLDDINEKESKDLFSLLEEIKQLLKNSSDEDITITMNSGVHSSEPHLHFHLLPAKGNIRELISTYENVPRKKEISRIELESMKLRLLEK